MQNEGYVAMIYHTSWSAKTWLPHGIKVEEGISSHPWGFGWTPTMRCTMTNTKTKQSILHCNNKKYIITIYSDNASKKSQPQLQ
jgi:hypothetical protein